jgi:signal transduction histidine kinase
MYIRYNKPPRRSRSTRQTKGTYTMLDVVDSPVGTWAAQSGYQQGLIGMRERVMLLGGQLSIECIPGNGTHLNVDMPLPQ